MTSAARETLFVTCAPGIEPLLHAEIRAQKLAHVEQQVGGVACSGTRADVWRLNLELRTAVRVLIRVARFTARDEHELYRGVQEVDWSRWLRADSTLRVDASVNESALGHSLYVEQKTKDAIVDQFRAASGTRPSVDLEDPALGVHVHLFRDRCTVLLDSSGESLHKRGWRRYQGRAPLAETLAAATVLASEWDRKSPLVDPYCGSGTILLEAALIASDTPPGVFRERFGFERWPDHEAAAFTALRAAARARTRPTPKLVLRGSDASSEAIAGARENLAAAGLADRVTLEIARAESIEWKRGWNGWIVSNLPYGERVGDERDLAPALQRFGANVRAQCAGYRYALLSGNAALERALGLAPERALAWKNGALDCRLLVGAI